VDVLDREYPGTTKTGRFWVYLGDKDHPQIVFTYTPSRSRNGPMEFLKGWGKDQRVYLQADAYGGYDGIYLGEAGGHVIEVACFAHYPELCFIQSNLRLRRRFRRKSPHELLIIRSQGFEKTQQVRPGLPSW
jgi:hypothetical protein